MTDHADAVPRDRAFIIGWVLALLVSTALGLSALFVLAAAYHGALAIVTAVGLALVTRALRRAHATPEPAAGPRRRR